MPNPEVAILQQRQDKNSNYPIAMNPQETPISLPDIEFPELEAPPQLNQQLLSTIDTNIGSTNWVHNHFCITMVRQIAKHDPTLIPDLINRYSNAFVDLFASGKTQLVKNLLRMVKEIFDVGSQVNVERAVYVFLPILLKKSSTDLGHIKEMSQQALTSFSNNCGYPISYVIASGYCCDKSTQISEVAVRLLSRLIENVGNSFVDLDANALQSIMKNLSGLVDGKRQNLRNQGLDICLFIYTTIGSENYVSLMNYALKPQQIESMAAAMEQHRSSKQKVVPLANLLRERRSMMPQKGQRGGFNCPQGNLR